MVRQIISDDLYYTIYACSFKLISILTARECRRRIPGRKKIP